MISYNKIIVNIDSNNIKINPHIYSNFIEHLGECIHNGIWTYDPVNVQLVKENPRLIKVREDLLKAVVDLKISVLRWPGGCYSDVYHWKDAIGSRDSRKVVKNLHWGEGTTNAFEGLAPIIENQFGTDEFLTFCEVIKAESYLNINYGTGTPREAAEWVEYCNGTIDTKFGALRAKNGRTEPYNVKIWGIANEIYAPWEKGYEKYPENYAKKYMAFAKAMKKKDPTIKLVACGCDKSDWNQTLLKHLGDEWVDYLSIHEYLPFKIAKVSRKKHPDNKKCYHALMASAILIETFINDTWKDIVSALGKDTRVRISFDEWGLWYLFKDVIKTNYNLQDGLWTAMILMVFQKMSNKCPMANWAQLVNCIGTIQTDIDGLILTPVYLAFKMIVDHSYNNFIESMSVECETFENKKFGQIPNRIDVPYIECNATINDRADELSIAIINKHFTNDLEINLEIRGFSPKEKGILVKLNGDSPFDYNTIENRNKIQIKTEEINSISSNMTIKIHAHSFTIVKLTKN
ncbi:MAG: alpha-L-arabinofuranosidase C-terminal domain-containing protein [Promethearchaeota archaeon]